MTAAIEVDGLVKAYGDVRAVDDVSFRVEPGEVFCLLGPNGAGKSTTVEILEGHRRADGGHVRVLGHDPAEGGPAFRDRIGIVLQSSGIDRELTVREVLELYGSAYRRRRPVEDLVEMVELADKVDARITTLSGGQQRRIDLALGLVGDPDLVFLDEPTTGFDPAARRRSWDLVAALADHGHTVVLTTHYLDEAEHLADRIVVLARGRVVAEGTPAELRASVGSRSVIRFALPVVDEPLSGLLDGLAGTASGRDRTVEVVTEAATADLARLTGWAAERGLELGGLTVTRPNLEDVYLGLVGESGDGTDAVTAVDVAVGDAGGDGR